MGPYMFLDVPSSVGNPNFSPLPPLRPAKSAERLAPQQELPAERGKKLFRYFSTFLTYLVKIADELLRIMNNLGAWKHSAVTVERQSCCAKPGSLCCCECLCHPDPCSSCSPLCSLAAPVSPGSIR